MSFGGYHEEEDDKTEIGTMRLQDADDCWNEGLDREWSYDLHLHQHFSQSIRPYELQYLRFHLC